MSGRLGIIGGGQLGGFLCRAARSLGVQTTVLSGDPEGMGARYADAVIEADLDDLGAIEALVERSDVVTFELEAVPTSALDTLQAFAARSAVRVFPEPTTMLLLQNKATQKDWLVENGFPTPPYIRFAADKGASLRPGKEKLGCRLDQLEILLEQVVDQVGNVDTLGRGEIR